MGTGSTAPAPELAQAWADEIHRAFANPKKLHGVGTPELKRLLGVLQGQGPASDDELTRFMVDAASSVDESIASPDEQRVALALSRGACAWLFMPSPSVEMLISLREANRRKGNLPKVDSVAIRAAWASSIRHQVVQDRHEPAPYQARSGSNLRAQFQDALTSAITRHLAALGMNLGAAALPVFNELADASDDDRSSIDSVRFMTDSGAEQEELGRLVGVAPDQFEGELNEQSLQFEPAIRAVLDVAVEQLDRAVSYAPATMRPTNLVASITVSPISYNRPPQSRGTGTQLYSDWYSSGGTPALATLVPHRRAVLLGDPGAGKSTILAARYIDHIERDDRNIAVYARLSDVGEIAKVKPPKSSSEAASVIVEAFASWSETRIDHPTLLKLRDALVEDPRSMVALDGLDEVHGAAARQAVEETFRNLRQIPGSVVVTSRFTGYSSPSGSFEEFEVDCLEPDQVEAFLSLWFPAENDAGRDRVRAAMRESPPVASLMRIPLMSVLVAFVAERERVPLGVSALYDRYIALFLERRWKQPGQQRHELSDIANIVSLAANIAWEMGIGPSIGQTLETLAASWTDTIFAHQLVELAQNKTHELEQLIGVDGLLTIHGSSGPDDPVLFRQYRWLHRTIHEHLLGVRLAKLMQSDSETVIDFVITGMQGLVPYWEFQIAHAVDQMTAKQQDLLLQGLWKRIEDGDPGGVLGSVLMKVARMAGPMSSERANLTDEFIRADMWHEASLVDVQRTRLAMRAGVPRGDSRSGIAYLMGLGGSDGFPDVVEQSDRDLVASLVASMCDERPPSPFLGGPLRTLARIDPERATRLALDHLRRAPTKRIGNIFDRKYQAPKMLVAQIHREAIRRDFPENRHLVELLRQVEGPEILLTKEDYHSRPGYCVARIVDAPGQALDLLQTPHSFLRDALGGNFGDAAAFEISKRYHRSSARPIALCPWAEVGYLITLLERNPGHGRSTNRQFGSDVLEAVYRFRLLSIDDIRDPIVLSGVLRSLVACAQTPTQEQILAVMELLLRTTQFADSVEPGNESPPGITWADLKWILTENILPQHKQLIWPILESGELDPRGHLHGVQSLLHIAFSRPTAEGQVGRALLVDVCRWGTSVGVPVLPAFPYVGETKIAMEDLLANVGHHYLGREDNLAALVHWLWVDGTYPAWRDQLLTLAGLS